MPSFTGGGLGVTWGFVPHEDGWADSYNLNFQQLDTIVQLNVISFLDTPPGSPAAEDRYIVEATATGDWTGQEGNIAVWTKKEDPDSRAWVFFTPEEGWVAYNKDTGTDWRYDGAAWVEFSPLPPVGTDGQVLTIVTGAVAWADPVEELPAPGVDGQVLTLVAGAPSWEDSAGGGGAGFDLTDGGAWDGGVAYTKGTIVDDIGKRYIAAVDIAAPTGTPGVDGEAHADGSGASLTIVGLDTTGTADTICIAAAWNSDPTAVDTIVSDSGLVFVQRASQTRTNISGHRLRVELWTAPVSAPLTNEDITITLDSGLSSDFKAVAFGVFGGDISDPLDAHADSLKTNSGDRTAPGVTGFSTSNADDLLIFIAASDSDGGAGLVANTAPATWTLLNYQGNAVNDGSPNVVNLAVSTKLVSGTQSAIAISDGGDPSVWGAIAAAVKASGAANLSPADDPQWILVDDGVTSDLLDSLLGSIRGSTPYRGAAGWTSEAPGTVGHVWTSNGAGADPTWQAGGGGGGDTSGAGGVFRQIMSLTPTLSNTGLATWLNQGSASIANTAIGLSLTSPTNSNNHIIRGRYKAVPATPYEVVVLISLTTSLFNNYAEAGIGWYDGTNKIQLIKIGQRNAAPSPIILIDSYSTPSAFNASHFSGTVSVTGYMTWLKIADDGTNVSFQWSADGVNFKTLYSVAKASGYLGSSGYSNILFATNAYGADVVATLLSFGDPAGAAGGTTFRLEAPATGATIALDPEDTLLIINPAAAIATLTVTMPAGVDGQKVTISTRQRIDALTITGDGSEAVDWPDGELPQYGAINLLYVDSITTWVLV